MKETDRQQPEVVESETLIPMLTDEGLYKLTNGEDWIATSKPVKIKR